MDHLPIRERISFFFYVLGLLAADLWYDIGVKEVHVCPISPKAYVCSQSCALSLRASARFAGCAGMMGVRARGRGSAAA